MTVQTEQTLKAISFDPKSQKYILAVTRFYGFLAGKLAHSSVVRCISYTPGIYDVASATDVWTDYRVVKMAAKGDTWGCGCESEYLCWHITAAAATHHYTNPVYNPIHILNGFLAARNDQKNSQWPGCEMGACQHVEMFPAAHFCQVHFDAAQEMEKAQTAHDPTSNHSLTCGCCLVAAGTPDTRHWSITSHNFWACRKMWGLGACGGRAVSVGGYCAPCAAAGWDDRQAGR